MYITAFNVYKVITAPAFYIHVYYILVSTFIYSFIIILMLFIQAFSVCVTNLGGNMARFTQFPLMITRSTIIYKIISPGAAGSSIYV